MVEEKLIYRNGVSGRKEGKHGHINRKWECVMRKPP